MFNYLLNQLLVVGAFLFAFELIFPGFGKLASRFLKTGMRLVRLAIELAMQILKLLIRFFKFVLVRVQHAKN